MNPQYPQYPQAGQPPALMPTKIEAGQAPGVQYRVQGELVPALSMWLDGTVNVFFEHHVVLWKSPRLTIHLKPLKGAFKRMIAGMHIFMTRGARPRRDRLLARRRGPCLPAASAAWPGDRGARAPVPRRHRQFGLRLHAARRASPICSSAARASSWTASPRDESEGVVWLHGYGNVFEKALAPGEQIDVEPGGWIYRDESVRMEPMVYGLQHGHLRRRRPARLQPLHRSGSRRHPVDVRPPGAV